jgi:hypothetical protein
MINKTLKPESSLQRNARRLINSSFLKSSTGHCLLVFLFYSLLFALFFSRGLLDLSYLPANKGQLGDALVAHLPYYLSEKLSWDSLISCGFPMIADSQAMSWYPPALFLSLIPGTWNIFVISAYVMAACFTYGYVYTLTESRMAALTSGITYSMCGFMFAHLGHTAMIHTAAWLPLIVWSLEMLRRRFSRFWLAVGCVAVACCVFAGHLQIVAYSLIVSAAYALALGWNAPTGRKSFLLLSTLLLVLGLGLAAMQILPTAELASFSTRTDYAFENFVSYSLPYKHLPAMLFPAVFGGLLHYGTAPYFGEWNFVEMTGYVGLLPLMLAGVGFYLSRRKGVSIFWLCVGVMAFLLALGERTPLSTLVYHLPVLGQFRVPARHFIEIALAVSVLAGFGVRAVLHKEVTKRLMLVVVAALAIVMTGGLLALLSSKFSQHALSRGVADFSALPWANRAIGVPLIIFLAAIAVLLYWRKQPASLPRRALLISLLVIDLASFGWLFMGSYFSSNRNLLNPPPAVGIYRDLLRDSNQRMLTIRGTLGTPDELPPNLARIWGIPNATGYGPLIPSRVMYLLSILPDGSIASSWRNVDDQSLNITSTRYVTLPASGMTKNERGISWQQEDMGVWLGKGCDHPPLESVRFSLSAPFKATSVRVVSRLACAVSMIDGEEVAHVLLTDVDGNVQTVSLLAGRDSSEWSYDCPNIKPNIQHGRAEVFSTFPAKMFEASCDGHFYLAKLKLDSARPISNLEIRWVGQSGAISIEKISLIDEATNNSEAINPLSVEGSQWRFVADAGRARIYENPRAMPRAWLVPEVLNLKPEDVLIAIKQSRLPDGRQFDPARTALLEEPLSLSSQNVDPAASAQITQFSNTLMEVQTSSVSPSFLVTSDVYYPGWQATLDGAPIKLFRANYALRGVQVPAGNHVVRFEYTPKTFYYGAAISALSLVALAGLLSLSSFSRKFAKFINNANRERT